MKVAEPATTNQPGSEYENALMLDQPTEVADDGQGTPEPRVAKRWGERRRHLVDARRRQSHAVAHARRERRGPLGGDRMTSEPMNPDDENRPSIVVRPEAIEREGPTAYCVQPLPNDEDN